MYDIWYSFSVFVFGIGLEAAHILEVGYWPNDPEQFAIFGEEKIDVLAEHFKMLLEKNDFDQEESLSEWLDLKVLVKNNYRHLRKQELRLKYHGYSHSLTPSNAKSKGKDVRQA